MQNKQWVVATNACIMIEMALLLFYTRCLQELATINANRLMFLT